MLILQIIHHQIQSEPAKFNSKSIDSSICSSTGKFQINGVFTSELEDELWLSKPEKVSSSCSIKKGKKMRMELYIV